MGKSYKKFPAYGNAADTDKPYKRQSNRRSRKNSKQKLREKIFFENDYDISGEDLENKNFGNEYFSMKDGKSVYDGTAEDEDYYKYYGK